jgi:hypothetical protein
MRLERWTPVSWMSGALCLSLVVTLSSRADAAQIETAGDAVTLTTNTFSVGPAAYAAKADRYLVSWVESGNNKVAILDGQGHLKTTVTIPGFNVAAAASDGTGFFLIGQDRMTEGGFFPVAVLRGWHRQAPRRRGKASPDRRIRG